MESDFFAYKMMFDLSGQYTACLLSFTFIRVRVSECGGYVRVHLRLIPREPENKSNGDDGGQSPLSR